MRRTMARKPLKAITLDANKVTAMAQHIWQIAGPTCCQIMGLPYAKWGELSEKTNHQYKAVATAALMKGATL